MSRSEVEQRRPVECPTLRDAPRLARPNPPIERAFRWIVDYRSRSTLEKGPERVLA